MTLQLVKYIADAGICSRRAAVELIKLGKITVNGRKVVKPALLILPGDVVMYDRKVIQPAQKVYLMLHKPIGYITTHSDEKGRATIFDLIPQAKKTKLIAVGRLDKDTSGLLLITNDGAWAQRLAHPRFEMRKKYEITLDRPLRAEDRARLVKGVELNDGFLKPDHVTGAGKSLFITIHSGKNRVIRRLIEHIGYRVVHLARIAFAGITLKRLPVGRCRPLTTQELETL